VLLGIGLGYFIGQLAFRGNELWRSGMNGGLLALPATPAAGAAHAVIDSTPPGYAPLILAALLAVVTYRILNMGLFSLYRATRFGHPFLKDWRSNSINNWPSQLFSAPLAVLLVVLSVPLHSVWLALALTAASGLTLPFARQELAYYQRSREMVNQIVEAVLGAIERVVPGARDHSERVSTLAVSAGRQLGMPERALQALDLAARLHDVGMLATSGRLDAKEDYAVVGGRILAHFPDPLIAEIVLTQHERWDASHKRGLQSPLGARILAAAEAYDIARTGQAPFKQPQSHSHVAPLLTTMAGTVFDPRVVGVVVEIATAQDKTVHAQ